MSIVRTTHNAGFFSNCSIRLENIVKFINSNNCLPEVVDSSKSYSLYKNKGDGDITFNYFEQYDNKEDFDVSHIASHGHNDQFKQYTTINYAVLPLINKYFSPAKNILDIIETMETKYEIDYENICVLFYRGNDKYMETRLCEYDEYIRYADEVLKKNPKTQFLIQTDETEFLEFIQDKYPNSFYFKDEIRHMKKCKSTVDKVMRDKNSEFSKYYLAITIIMSKCKYIVCGSGNCSIWIIYYRGHAQNVYQNLKGKWFFS